MAAFFSSTKGVSFLGGSGDMPPGKFLKLDAWKCSIPDSIWALRTIKIKTILTIFYVYYNHFFLKISITGFGTDAILAHGKA